MDKLLTIKETAALLNVSEMSLRRWTNSGKLKCYRLGGKNERRFNKQDILAFLQGEPKHTPLGINDIKSAENAHIAHFYNRAEEGLAEGIAYLGKGLSRGETILLISTQTKLSKTLQGLEDSGFPVRKLIDDGVIMTNSGQHDSSEHIQYMTSAIANINHPNGFRLLGDMTWALEQGWSLSEIQSLENNTNQALTANNRLFLCQYDLTIFGAEAAMMALDTHGQTIYRGELKESPYFVAPAG